MKYEICLQWKFYQGHISGVNVEKFDDKYFAKESKVGEEVTSIREEGRSEGSRHTVDQIYRDCSRIEGLSRIKAFAQGRHETSRACLLV
ncbi:hypothetical protein QYF36_023132 [Acer negundo]|nr:hypothetical protein QYF36_023132 [Acer negundo]